MEEQPGAALLPGDGHGHHHQHGQQHHRQNQEHPHHGPHHAHGPRGHELRGNQKQQQGVVLFQGGETVVILGAAPAEIGADRVLPVQGGAEVGDRLFLHLLQGLQHVVRLYDAVAGHVVMHPGAVAFENIRLVLTAVGAAVVVGAQGIDILEQDGVGKAGLRCLQGRVQLLHERPVAALMNQAVGEEAVPCFPIGNPVNIGPDAVPARRVIAVSLAVQQHQHGAVAVHFQQLLQPADISGHLLLRIKILVPQGIDRGGQVIPVGIQGVVQIGAHLGGDLIELGGTLRKDLRLQVPREIYAACCQRQQQTDGQYRRKQDAAPASLWFHSARPPFAVRLIFLHRSVCQIRCFASFLNKLRSTLRLGCLPAADNSTLAPRRVFFPRFCNGHIEWPCRI